MQSRSRARWAISSLVMTLALSASNALAQGVPIGGDT